MIHHVYANQSNVGDWLSAQGIQALLAPLPVQEHLCDTPFVAETLTALSKAVSGDFIVIGGGGLLMDYFEPFWAGFAAIAGRVPFAIWGVGCCDMKLQHTRPRRALIADIIQRSALCVVRDELTQRMFPESSSPGPIICPTVAGVAPRGGEHRTLLHVDHYDNVGADIYELMVAVGDSFAKDTGRSYRRTNNLIPAGDRRALANTLDLYASADLVLTSRLHGAIIALAMGRRVLIVSGDHKVESFMSAAGLGEWVCDLSEVAALRIRLERLHDQRPPLEFIENGRRQNRAVAEQIRALIDDHTPRLPHP